MLKMIILIGLIFPVFEVPLDAGYDLEATEVICHETETGEKYFSYIISNIGTESAPKGSYAVFFKVNGKMISFETATTELEAGKFIIYTSEHKFEPKARRKRVSFNRNKLKYKLIINSKDANSTNNKKKGEILL